MYGYIYKTTNKVNGKIYIGQKKGLSFNKNYLGSGKLLKKAIEKYGKESFECFPLRWCWTFDEANEQEVVYIAYYKSQDKKIGYNIAKGGNTGHEHTEEWKKKASEYSKKNPNSGWFKKGHIVDQKVRDKISATLKGRSCPSSERKVLCHQTNITYKSIREASERLLIDRGSISSILCNRTKKTKDGYTFEYV